jgi:hypothetical protein
MSEQRVVLGMLAAAAATAIVLTLAFRGRSEPPVHARDPAIEHHLQGRNKAYAGVDLWAYHGMSQELFTVRLEQAGFACELHPAPMPGEAPLPGVEEITCTQTLRRPVPRTLVVTAGIEHGLRPRLVHARAESRVEGSFRPVATLLRKLEWIEPAHLQVRGFELDTPQLLARYAADALNGGWADACSVTQSPTACAQLARQRRATGFPAVDRGARAPDYPGLVRTMEQIRLRPAWPAAFGSRPTDQPAVRVAGENLWLDFAGQDLAGHALRVSFLLAMEGGRPVKMVAGVDDKESEVMLSGEPRRHNDGSQYLIPHAGAGEWRTASWLAIPGRHETWATRRIAQELPRSEPRFAAAFIKKLLDTLAKPESPDMDLGLFPALLMVERMAEALRASNARDWLPQEVGGQILRAAYPQHPTLRAGWVLAVCEPEPDAVGANPECWRRATELDPELLKLLRDDLATLSGWYAGLPAHHPLQARLARWRSLLAS